MTVTGLQPPRAGAYRRGVQRLYSVFPNGVPGAGLLLLRVAIVAGSWLELGLRPVPLPWAWVYVLTGIASVALLAGAGTPPAALLHALLALLPFGSGLDPQALAFGVVSAGASVALALLGPGAWSLDALRFGRRVHVLAARAPPDADDG